MNKCYNFGMDMTDRIMTACRLCPRACGADRLHGETGVCGVPADLYAGRAMLHHWEEPCISGTAEDGTDGGAGAVFFSGCVLKCVYCQNYGLSHIGHRERIPGKKITVERLAEIFLELQDEGANNIDLVTPTQYIPQIAEALRLDGHHAGPSLLQNTGGPEGGPDSGVREDAESKAAAGRRQLTIPVICNCGGYESAEALRLFDGLVDVYLTDFKYMEHDAARKYSAAGDYPERAAEALEEMVRQCPAPVFDDKGLIRRGVIIRHLVLPGMVHNSKEVVRFIYETYGDAVWLSLMNQYTPYAEAAAHFPELGRRVTKREYDAVVDYAIDLGVENAYIQEGATQKESFIPSFDGEGI